MGCPNREPKTAHTLWTVGNAQRTFLVRAGKMSIAFPFLLYEITNLFLSMPLVNFRHHLQDCRLTWNTISTDKVLFSLGQRFLDWQLAVGWHELLNLQKL